MIYITYVTDISTYTNALLKYLDKLTVSFTSKV